MDPLSLTCSVVALTQAASSIASSLYTAFEALRTADERIASFCDEVQNLAGFLNAINKALTECGSMGMATVGEDLWRQSELTLKDIGTTLREMELLVNQIKENNTDGRPYGKSLKRRARIAIDLKAHGTALLSFRDRILKSNWALQTILNTIAVSVSLRNSASQESILMALNRLKRSVDDAFHGTRQTDLSARARTRDRFEVQMAHNLHKLAKAAQTFHTTASATASTIHGGSARVDLWDSPLGATVMSIAGDLSPFQRERIEGYIDGQMQHCLEEEAYSTLIPVLPENDFEAGDYESYTSMYNCDQQEHGYNMIDGDDDSELEKLFVDNLMELAENHIRDGKFASAKECLHEALQQNFDVVSHMKLRRLHVLLSFCDIMQGDWKLAEPLVVELEKSSEYEYLEAAGRLLHAVTLGHLCEFSFDDAEKRCRRVWKIRKRILRQTGHLRDKYHYDDALGLFAMIYEMKGDYRRAGILRGKQPDFVYHHPASQIDYLLEYEELLGIDLPRFFPKSNNRSNFGTGHPEMVDEGTYHLPVGEHAAMANDMHQFSYDHRPEGLVQKDSSHLRLKQDQWEKLEIDTSKEVYFQRPSSPMVLDGVDVVGDLTTLSPQRMSSLHRKLSKIFRYRKAQDAGEEMEMIRIRVKNDAHRSNQSNTSTTDLTRWLSKRSRLFRKSKTLFRKRVGGNMVNWEDSACFASLSSDSNSDEDDTTYGASTPVWEDDLDWQEKTASQHHAVHPESNERQGRTDRHVRWKTSLSSMPEQPGEAFLDAVDSAENASEHDDVFRPLTDPPETGAEKQKPKSRRAKSRQSRAQRMKAKIAASILAKSATSTPSNGPLYGVLNSIDDSGYDSGYGTDCGDQYVPRSDRASLMALVLRHMDYLYAMDTRRPDWLNDIELLVDNWPDTLEERYPAWGERLGRRHQDCLCGSDASEDTPDAAENPVSVRSPDRSLRRACSWVSGSEERYGPKNIVSQPLEDSRPPEESQIGPDCELPAELHGDCTFELA